MIGLFVGIFAFVLLNVFWLHWFRPHVSLGNGQVAKFFNKLSWFRSVAGNITKWSSLSKENSELKISLQAVTADSAELSQIQRENDQLRKALGLSSRTHRSIIPGSIYNLSLAPDGYTALINKGIQDNVADGDIILDEHRVLIGIVQHIFTNSSRITLISDPVFKVTAIVLGGQTKGIAKGALSNGMVLDLVIQSDEIKEGDKLVTSGDDVIPAGLVIGTVQHVESSSAKLFKEVSVRPDAELMIGEIFIMK